jgi:hypothetical protein
MPQSLMFNTRSSTPRSGHARRDLILLGSILPLLLPWGSHGAVLTPIRNLDSKGDGPASITLEWGTSSTISLQPGIAEQHVPIFLRNPGADLEVGGLDIKFGLEGTGGSFPAFSSVDLQASSFVSPSAPFQVSNSVQGADANNTPQLQFWSVSINDPFAPPSLSGGGALTQVGLVGFSTIGVNSGMWTLSFRPEATALISPFGDNISILFRDANLQVVPEPEEWATMVAGILLGLGVLLRRGGGAVAEVASRNEPAERLR